MLDRARLEDAAEIEELLRSVGLPAADVAGDGLFAHWVWRRDGRVVATVGLDIVGSEAVLRSLATHADCRGQRIASALCDAAEEEARRQSVAAVYLLTEAAQRFAEQRGYHIVSRASVPESVASHRQFRTGCCGCAPAMAKRL